MIDDSRWEEVGAEIRELRTRVAALEPGMGTQIPAHDPQETTAPEVEYAGEIIADLRRELEGARRVAADQRRIANELRGDLDAVTRELERLKLDLAERAESPRESCAAETAVETAENGESG